MKYKLTIVAFLACGVAWAEVVEPKWIEFCPDEYIDAQVGKVTELNYGDRILTNSIFGSRKQKQRQADIDRNYWARRRNQFEGAINQCRNQEGDKTACYMSVRQIEYDKTNALSVSNQLSGIHTGVNKVSRQLRLLRD